MEFTGLNPESPGMSESKRSLREGTAAGSCPDSWCACYLEGRKNRSVEKAGGLARVHDYSKVKKLLLLLLLLLLSSSFVFRRETINCKEAKTNSVS